MKKKYTKEEKVIISKEAIEERNGKIYAVNANEIALKYDIHLSTVYSWVAKYHKKNGRSFVIGVRLSQEEKDQMEKICKELGYENDVRGYLRRLILGNTIATGNPRDIIKELYANRAELNKIGSNLNQIANYTNFLHSQGYNDNDYEKDFKKYTQEMNAKLYEMRGVLDNTIRKIYK